MLSVGITGGMGSGKTLICMIFKVLGISVYHSDVHAKRLMEEDEQVKSELIMLLGPECYLEGRTLHRKYIANKVFQSPPLLKELNHIVHPAVKRDALLWQKKLPEHEPYYIRESAILFETGIYKELDYNILVSSPEHIRIGRIAKRDLLTFEEIEARLKQQGSEEEKLPLSDFQIINDGQTFLIPQVLNIHLKLMDYFLKLADRHSGTAP